MCWVEVGAIWVCWVEDGAIRVWWVQRGDEMGVLGVEWSDMGVLSSSIHHNTFFSPILITPNTGEPLSIEEEMDLVGILTHQQLRAALGQGSAARAMLAAGNKAQVLAAIMAAMRAKNPKKVCVCMQQWRGCWLQMS